MKKLAIFTILASLAFNAFALSFKVGANAGQVTEADLMTALRQGKGAIGGKKIIVKAGANVPPEMKTKWMERQFSGADAPAEGSASDDVIFVEGF